MKNSNDIHAMLIYINSLHKHYKMKRSFIKRQASGTSDNQWYNKW